MRGHAIVVLNLPVPDDRRVWAEACALRDAGRPVVVLCPAMRGHRPGTRTHDGIVVRYLRTIEGRGPAGVVVEGVWNTLLCLLAVPWLRRQRVGSIQVCNPPDSLFPLLVVGRLLGMRAVYDQHDVAPAMATARRGLGWLRPLLELLERATVRSAQVVLTSSDVQRRRLAERYGADAVLVRSATLADQPAPARHGSGGVRLGYLGVIGEQEGLEDLLRALVDVRRRGRDVSLVIAGDGPYLPDVRREAAALDLGDAVTFAGWLQGEALESFLRSLDAMVVSDPESEYNHACAMNKVIEAMARGLPVVMRPLQENRNLTGDNRWTAPGWSVTDLAEAITSFVDASADERRHEGERLRRRYAAECAWADHRERYLRAVTAVPA